MKKLALLLMLIGAFVQAQVKTEHALGLRLGTGNGLGYELSYQKGLSDVNRLQFDLGAKSNSGVNFFKLSGAYQWVKDLSNLADGFNWFYGAGAGLGASDSNSGSTTFINALGDLGIEYNFEFPLQLTLGIRPELAVVNGDGFSTDLALGVRYRFE